jgi:hypothetical protein
MKTFDFIQATISHNLKDADSKALEPGCLSPLLGVTTQSLEGSGLLSAVASLNFFKGSIHDLNSLINISLPNR